MSSNIPYSHDRKIKIRLRWFEHYEQISRNTAATARYFGIARSSFYYWYGRYKKDGIKGLRDLSRRPHRIQYQIPQDIIN